MSSVDLVKKPKLGKILTLLSMVDYFPGKISLDKVFALTKQSLEDEHVTKPEDLGWHFIRKIFQYNYLARDISISKLQNDVGSSSRGKRALFKKKEFQSNPIHPLDVVAAVFLCCDPFCQQDLASRLWSCRLAVPFILPMENEPPKLFIWPLRSLVMAWDCFRGGEVESIEDSIVTHCMCCIGFVRFGESDFSKSAFINSIISDSEKTHPIFFHRDSPGSSKEKNIVDGMVELGWFFPKGTKHDNFQSAVCFANLRGDARNHAKQVEILTIMANIIVVLCTVNELEESQSLLKRFLDKQTSVLVTLLDKTQTEETLGKVETIIDNFGAEPEVLDIMSVHEKQRPELISNARQLLKGLKTTSPINLKDVGKHVAHIANVDEFGRVCKSAKQKAKAIAKVCNECKPEVRKQSLLPLQGQYWEDWASADKELYRQKRRPKGEDCGKYSFKQDSIREESRKKQVAMIQDGLPQHIRIFIDTMLKSKKMESLYFLRWLKLMCDELSRKDMPPLFKQYKMVMRRLSEADVNDRIPLNAVLNELDKKMNQLSFGLEHILREIAQIYESVEGYKGKEKLNRDLLVKVQSLPVVGAKILQYGYPIEIMDGEVGAVPTTWIQSLFAKVSKHLAGERKEVRVFALSILGIQSSGKSTLLNTVFGLQFAVSAGRCTKGVFLQLVKVDDSVREMLGCDFIIAVDTEGLKSPELSSIFSRRHDNELATFVIGLGDTTLLNLMGENTIVLEEILPISVHAFLRMEKVGLQPQCMVVHQNVDKKNKEKLLQQQRTLENKLNDATVIACGFESVQEKLFKQIIDFNINEDVDYMPTLLEGSQPMSPISLGYSEAANAIKRHLLPDKRTARFKGTNTMETFMQRICDLWDAIKKDSFVYEFKNTIETEARGKLDREWSDASTQFRSEVARFSANANTSVQNSTSETDLTKTSSDMLSKLKELMDDSYKKYAERLESFFQNVDKMYEESMLKWKVETEERLKELKRELVGECKTNLDNICEIRHALFKLQSERTQYERDLVAFITKFVRDEKKKTKVKQLNYNETELRQLFDQEWSKWLEDICNKYKRHDPQVNIKADVEQCLRQRLSTHEKLLNDKLFKLGDPKSTGKNESQDLRCYTFNNFFPHEKHLESKESKAATTAAPGLVTTLKQFIKGKKTVTPVVISEQHKTEIVRMRALDSMHKAHDVLTKFEDRGEPYNTGMVATVFKEMDKGMSTEKKTEHNLVFTHQFRVDLDVHIAGQTIEILEKMNKKVSERHNPNTILNQSRERYFRMFKVSFDQTNVLGAVAVDIKEIVEKGIVEKIQKDLPVKIIEEASTKTHVSVLNSKKSFLMDVLRRITEKDEFDDYYKYIHFPRHTMEDYLKQYFAEYCDEKENRQTRLQVKAEQMVRNLLSCVHSTVSSVNDSFRGYPATFNLWLATFGKEAKDKFIVQDLQSHSFPETDHFKIETLTEELLKEIELIGKGMAYLLKVILSQKARQKYEQTFVAHMLKNIIGCTEQCPFCGEICIRATPNHEESCDHETPIHRPQGCTGFHVRHTDLLVTRACTTSIASEIEFFHGEEIIPYKEYKTIYPKWKIPGDPSMEVSSFWTWFFVDHLDDLVAKHELQKPEIPDMMKKFTRKEEIEKLKKACSS